MNSISDMLKSCIRGGIREEIYLMQSEMWLSSSGGRHMTSKGVYTEREEQ